MNKILYSVFGDEEHILAATREVRRQGFSIADTYTPFPVHGMDAAMGMKPSRLTWACFLYGLIGSMSMLAFMFWTSAVSWPLDVGGKPFNSLPAFIPVAFEVMVLCSGVGVVFTLLAVCRLYPGKKAHIPHEAATNDQFVLAVVEPETAGQKETVKAICLNHHATETFSK
jgi:hypothetical protein